MSELLDIEWLIERNKIIDVIVCIANAMDEQNWQRLREYLTDEIRIDYSEFRAELPGQITAEAYIQQRVEGLAGLKTLHISTNHEVTVTNKDARCRSAYRIYRFDRTYESDRNRLDTGNYEHRLVRVDGKWRVNAIRQTVVMLDGNRQIHKGL